MRNVDVEVRSGLGKVPKEFRKRLRPALRDAGRPIMEDAKRRASWSKRIPRSLALRVSFSARNPGVRIVARPQVAPHAYAYEGLARGQSRGHFRHPVFGNRDRWVSQAARPFLAPAVDAARDDVLRRMADVLTESAEASEVPRT